MYTGTEDLRAASRLMRRLSELRSRRGPVHPRFGDLARPDAVCMSGVPVCDGGYTEVDDVIIHLTVTGRCNAQCDGCINTAIASGCAERAHLVAELECDPARDADAIVRVAMACGIRPVTVALYGGEPLLAIDRIGELIERLDCSPIAARTSYMLYTNGQLLWRGIEMHPELWKRVGILSVSIDGDQEQHRRCRPGTDLASIEAGLMRLPQVFCGDILFWSTLREHQSLQSCFNQFMRYYQRGLVGHFFWHWAESPAPYRDFPAYVRFYAEELEEVLDTYVMQLCQGRLLSIVHINELILYLLCGRARGHSACAVELAENYDIVGGRLTACADLPLSIGALSPDASAELLRQSLHSLVGYRVVLGCDWCGVNPYCGGRCPVQVLAGSPERTTQICQLMRLHVGLVQERIGDIMDAMETAGITVQDLYRTSARLARYTDVVP